MAPEIVEVVERAAVREGATHRRLPSGAGHDAMEVGRHAPTGMLSCPAARASATTRPSSPSPSTASSGRACWRTLWKS